MTKRYTDEELHGLFVEKALRDFSLDRVTGVDDEDIDVDSLMYARPLFRKLEAEMVEAIEGLSLGLGDTDRAVKEARHWLQRLREVGAIPKPCSVCGRETGGCCTVREDE